MAPIYEYQCSNKECPNNDTPYEVEQKITDETLKRCPTCNGQFKKLISAGIGVKFNGTGWTPKHH